SSEIVAVFIVIVLNILGATTSDGGLVSTENQIDVKDGFFHPDGTLVGSFDAVFFFQAEDGIRDRNVTGVQTCALPISISGTSSSNSVLISSGSRRERITCGPFVPERTSVMTALMRDPCSYRSPSTCSERGSSASTFPRSTSTLFRSP